MYTTGVQPPTPPYPPYDVLSNGILKKIGNSFFAEILYSADGKIEAMMKSSFLPMVKNSYFFPLQVWCKRQLPQAALHTVMFDVHAPERYR